MLRYEKNQGPLEGTALHAILSLSLARRYHRSNYYMMVSSVLNPLDSYQVHITRDKDQLTPQIKTQGCYVVDSCSKSRPHSTPILGLSYSTIARLGGLLYFTVTRLEPLLKHAMDPSPTLSPERSTIKAHLTINALLIPKSVLRCEFRNSPILSRSVNQILCGCRANINNESWRQRPDIHVRIYEGYSIISLCSTSKQNPLN